MDFTKDYTATTFVICGRKVLLHLHKKIGVWLPVGGHIEPNELPHEAALREANEETGIEVKLYTPDIPIDFKDAQQLSRPIHLLLENISPNHQHVDFIYYGISSTEDLRPHDGETDNLKWFTAEEIRELKNVPLNVQLLSLEALDLIHD